MRADAVFIAAARQDIPDLVAEVERLRADNEDRTQCIKFLIEETLEEGRARTHYETRYMESDSAKLAELQKAHARLIATMGDPIEASRAFVRRELSPLLDVFSKMNGEVCGSFYTWGNGERAKDDPRVKALRHLLDLIEDADLGQELDALEKRLSQEDPTTTPPANESTPARM